ncbi:MAG: ring-cleaving dioxygenase [Gemmatimonadales bacterium]
MQRSILGLHHVTATVNEAQPDLDFYRGALGLRLVKKTVNFDNHNVYHFYYGDERGAPGTIWTTFPYAGWGVAPGRHGAGQITTTSFSVPGGSLSRWMLRLQDKGVPVQENSAGGGNAIIVTDPSGLRVRLIETTDDPRTPWTGNGISPDMAVRGLHSVTLTVTAPEPSVSFAREWLGFEVVDEAEGLVRLAVNGDLPGHALELSYGSDAPPARNGLGTVHHVALAIAGEDEQRRLRQELISRGISVTDVLDRQYFRSIYFREPGGVLYEAATMAPGFTVDEPLAALGQELKLPPWEEKNRAAIESSLPVIDPAER